MLLTLSYDGPLSNLAFKFSLRRYNGVMLSEEHGGPRIVFPALFGWKSAKFLAEVEFLPELRPAGTSNHCPTCHHRTRLNTRVMKCMAAYDVASNVWQAIGEGVLGEVGVPRAGAVGGGGAVGAGHQRRRVVRPPP
jgi:DMSO/TMAO reductase YedYZ molybdopterin-dependent catalytic subunit